MIRCKELNHDFDTQLDMFKALHANKEKIIGLKQSTVKNSEGFTSNFGVDKDIIKSIDGLEKGFIYPVINTTKYLDSHLDLHLDGIWKKSVGEQQGKVYYALNHDLSIGKIISYPADVEMFTKMVAWKDLGRTYDGETQALIFKTNLSDYSNADARNVIEKELPSQNSVRMQYVALTLAMNSDERKFVEERDTWEKHYAVIANKGVAEESKYFWAVSEAKIYKESSLVLEGSNDATPIIYVKEAVLDTSKQIDEAAKALQLKQFYN